MLNRMGGMQGAAVALALAILGGGSYHFLRLRHEGAETRALFRLVGPDSGLNYHELIPARQPDGQMRIVDIYIYYVSGERLSSSLRRSFIQMYAGQLNSLLAQLWGKVNDDIQKQGKIDAMSMHLLKGQPERVLAEYHQLPPSMQQDRMWLNSRGAAPALAP